MKEIIVKNNSELLEVMKRSERGSVIIIDEAGIIRKCFGSSQFSNKSTICNLCKFFFACSKIKNKKNKIILKDH